MTDITERAAELVAKHAKDLPHEVIKLLFEMSAEIVALRRSRTAGPPATTIDVGPVYPPAPVDWARQPIAPIVTMYGAAPSWPWGHGGGGATTTIGVPEKEPTK